MLLRRYFSPLRWQFLCSLQEAPPKGRPVGILYNEDCPGIRTGVELAGKAAAGNGMRASAVPMKGPGEIRAAFAALVEQGAEAVLIR